MKSFLLPSLRALAVVRAAFCLMTLALTATSLSPTGNAPAVPEDSRSLTAPGVVAEPVFRELLKLYERDRRCTRMKV
jgi:hypothetical protein